MVRFLFKYCRKLFAECVPMKKSALSPEIWVYLGQRYGEKLPRSKSTTQLTLQPTSAKHKFLIKLKSRSWLFTLIDAQKCSSGLKQRQPDNLHMTWQSRMEKVTQLLGLKRSKQAKSG